MRKSDDQKPFVIAFAHFTYYRSRTHLQIGLMWKEISTVIQMGLPHSKKRENSCRVGKDLERIPHDQRDSDPPQIREWESDCSVSSSNDVGRVGFLISFPSANGLSHRLDHSSLQLVFKGHHLQHLLQNPRLQSRVISSVSYTTPKRYDVISVHLLSLQSSVQTPCINLCMICEENVNKRANCSFKNGNGPVEVLFEFHRNPPYHFTFQRRFHSNESTFHPQKSAKISQSRVGPPHSSITYFPIIRLGTSGNSRVRYRVM